MPSATPITISTAERRRCPSDALTPISAATGAKIGRSWPKICCARTHAAAVASAACASHPALALQALGDDPRPRALDRLLEQRGPALARPRRVIVTSADRHASQPRTRKASLAATTTRPTRGRMWSQTRPAESGLVPASRRRRALHESGNGAGRPRASISR